ncbi:hypothetical protein R3P38DRAFT_3495969 [Favolaschia claudopus]|uniref:Uncharacterized protein n=1 Tax=Favolaschia claudopus TaxID=2862362 RepID=A0AAV9Z519_9AGAR
MREEGRTSRAQARSASPSSFLPSTSSSLLVPPRSSHHSRPTPFRHLPLLFPRSLGPHERHRRRYGISRRYSGSLSSAAHTDRTYFRSLILPQSYDRGRQHRLAPPPPRAARRRAACGEGRRPSSEGSSNVLVDGRRGRVGEVGRRRGRCECGREDEGEIRNEHPRDGREERDDDECRQRRRWKTEFQMGVGTAVEWMCMFLFLCMPSFPIHRFVISITHTRPRPASHAPRPSPLPALPTAFVILALLLRLPHSHRANSDSWASSSPSSIQRGGLDLRVVVDATQTKTSSTDLQLMEAAIRIQFRQWWRSEMGTRRVRAWSAGEAATTTRRIQAEAGREPRWEQNRASLASDAKARGADRARLDEEDLANACLRVMRKLGYISLDILISYGERRDAGWGPITLYFSSTNHSHAGDKDVGAVYNEGGGKRRLASGGEREKGQRVSRRCRSSYMNRDYPDRSVEKEVYRALASVWFWNVAEKRVSEAHFDVTKRDIPRIRYVLNQRQEISGEDPALRN